MTTRPQYPGVCWNRRYRRWQAYAKEGWRQVHLGYYDSYELAVEARKRWAQGWNDRDRCQLAHTD